MKLPTIRGAIRFRGPRLVAVAAAWNGHPVAEVDLGGWQRGVWQRGGWQRGGWPFASPRLTVVGRLRRGVGLAAHRPSVLGLCQRVYRVMNGTVTELDGAEGAKMVEDF